MCEREMCRWIASIVVVVLVSAYRRYVYVYGAEEETEHIKRKRLTRQQQQQQRKKERMLDVGLCAPFFSFALPLVFTKHTELSSSYVFLCRRADIFTTTDIYPSMASPTVAIAQKLFWLRSKRYDTQHTPQQDTLLTANDNELKRIIST